MSIEADERFVPREFRLPFAPFFRHFERYFKCVELLGRTGPSERWLDFACGSGYGSNFLMNFAGHVIGCDRDEATIQFARETYLHPSCEFLTDISMFEDHFNVVFSVETIEHMPREAAQEFLEVINRVLNIRGDLVISTPIVESTNLSPRNPFHFIEYSESDFVQLLGEAGFFVDNSARVRAVFTDGETKDQGYFKCTKAK